MQFISKIIKFLTPGNSKGIFYGNSGPSSLKEILDQFNQPPKKKTENDIIRDYQIFVTMANLEIDMLKMEPAKAFKGIQRFTDNEGKTFFDWVPCIVRPEVVYCSYGKN